MLQTLSLSDLLARPVPQHSWLVDRLLPRAGVMGLAGEPGTAKTWLLLEMARAVATGQPFLDRFATQQGPVLIIDEENGEARLQRRLARLANQPPADCPLYIASMCGLNLSQDLWIDSLRNKLSEIRPKLVLFDSLVRVHRGEENSAQDIARLFAVLTSFRREFGSAVVFTHHLRKMGFIRDMGQRIRGSSDILAYVDSMLGLSKVEATYTLSHLKNRDGDLIKPLSLSVEDTNEKTTVIRVIGEVDEETSKRTQARDLILEALADGDKLREELTALTRQAGISERTFAGALKELETAKLIVGSLEGRKKKYAAFTPLQTLQPIYPLQGSQGSPATTAEPLQPLQTYPLQGLQASQPVTGELSAENKGDPAFAPLQTLQPIYPLQGLQGSGPGNGELTLEEKQTLLKHWADRGRPTGPSAGLCGSTWKPCSIPPTRIWPKNAAIIPLRSGAFSPSGAITILEVSSEAQEYFCLPPARTRGKADASPLPKEDKMTTNTPQPNLDRLAHTTGLQAWVRDTQELPEAAARLLVTANRMAIVPHVILF